MHLEAMQQSEVSSPPKLILHQMPLSGANLYFHYKCFLKSELVATCKGVKSGHIDFSHGKKEKQLAFFQETRENRDLPSF